MDGWIKLHRKIIESDVWMEEEPFDKRSAWIDILLMANYKDGPLFNGARLIGEVPRGSFRTSIRFLAARWRWSIDKVRNYLFTLQELGMITITRTHNRTLVNVENYCVYQDFSDENRTLISTQNRTQTSTLAVHSSVTNGKKGKESKERKNNARTRARVSSELGPVKKTGFHNFEERHTNYDELFNRRKTS